MTEPCPDCAHCSAAIVQLRRIVAGLVLGIVICVLLVGFA